MFEESGGGGEENTMSIGQPRLNKTDLELNTIYVGDSVFICKDPVDPTAFNLFTNNGERETDLLLTRKNRIIMYYEELPRLLSYIGQLRK